MRSVWKYISYRFEIGVVVAPGSARMNRALSTSHVAPRSNEERSVGPFSRSSSGERFRFRSDWNEHPIVQPTSKLIVTGDLGKDADDFCPVERLAHRVRLAEYGLLHLPSEDDHGLVLRCERPPSGEGELKYVEVVRAYLKPRDVVGLAGKVTGGVGSLPCYGGDLR